MRTGITLRLGALIGASALVLATGAAPASATEPGHIEAPASAGPQEHREGRLASGSDAAILRHQASRAGTSPRATASTVDVKKIKAYHANLYDADVNFIDVDLYLNDWTDVEQIELDLKVNGKNKGGFPVYFDDEYGVFYIEVPGDIGLGKSVFTGSTVYYTEDSARPSTTDKTDSNKFNIRRGSYAEEYEDEFGDTWVAEYAWYGKWKSMEVFGLYIYSPSAGEMVPMKSVKLQYKKGSKWKTKKTMKLNDGYGYYEWKSSKKYRYRLYSPTTSTFEGMYIGPTDKF